MVQTQLNHFLGDVVAGLTRPAKALPCKYFYDAHGADLFDRICDLPEYYPTRCELAILEQHAAAIVDGFPPGCPVVEYGSGAGRKTRLLLEQLREGVYYPVDLSREQLRQNARQLKREFPRLEVVPICADFTQPFALPTAGERHVVYFSGSTIGNFAPAEAVRLLEQIRRLVGLGGGLLIGVDLKKDSAILEPAYNDAAGVTAEFNLNLLVRINRELDGDFDVGAFAHRAVYEERHGRIAMYLISQREQVAHVGGRAFHFDEGERICTEYSHKYSLADFARLADAARLTVSHVWTDADGLFSVQYARAR